ncbi:MAG: hypothetical protein AAFV95_24940 [Bacteroidota bacterium]
MKSWDDLSDLFRENEHKLHEAPPANSWKRLESRLDARRNRSQRPVVRMYRLAAAIAALFVLLTAIGLWLPSTQKTDLAVAEQVPQSWEYLSQDVDENQQMYRIVQISQRHHQQLDDPIREGRASQRFRLQHAVSEKLNHTRTGNRSEVRPDVKNQSQSGATDSLEKDRNTRERSL